MVLDSETILMDMLRDKVPKKTELVLIPKPEGKSTFIVILDF